MSCYSMQIIINMMMVFIICYLAKADDNWAVLIDSSKFYFNYRHTVNTLLIYQILKKYGFPDDRIILMLPENHQCHPRNPYPGKIFDGTHSEDLMADVEVDYRGLEVTPESFVNLLTGRHPAGYPVNKQLNSNKKSKVFLYMTGHGGNGYFKVQDTLVLKSADLSYAVYEMYKKERFGEMLIFLDTCQALSMFDYIDLDTVHGVSSSLIGQPAKSYNTHEELGLTTTDHFTYFFAEIFRGKSSSQISKMTLENVFKQLPESLIKSTIGYKSNLKPNQVLISPFIVYNYTNINSNKNLNNYLPSQAKNWKNTRTSESKAKSTVKSLEPPEKFFALGILLIGSLIFYLTNSL
jgi:GPI-anchor transamidase subunit K